MKNKYTFRIWQEVCTEYADMHHCMDVLQVDDWHPSHTLSIVVCEMAGSDGGAGKPVKVLFSGAVEGGLAGLCKKVEAANKKVGADVLFCVGQLFGGLIRSQYISVSSSALPLLCQFTAWFAK